MFLPRYFGLCVNVSTISGVFILLFKTRCLESHDNSSFLSKQWRGLCCERENKPDSTCTCVSGKGYGSCFCDE